MIKSDKWILEKCKNENMIEPFEEKQISKKEGLSKISYGVSSYGYDISLAPEMKLFTNTYTSVIDPKDFDRQSLVDLTLHSTHSFDCQYFILPPNSFALGRSIETINVPKRVTIICLGKSTYARCGLVVNLTPLECKWVGHITLEFSNTTNLPMKVYANEGIAQLLFFESDEDCLTSYADRNGKYQGQQGITLPRV
jgi:dCTP deaminase